MRSVIAPFRNIALTAFALFSFAQPAGAQPAGMACYGCGSCTCCDANGEVACIIVCGQNYCDCCSPTPGECSGNSCS
jgi:hypothetical protein